MKGLIVQVAILVLLAAILTLQVVGLRGSETPPRLAPAADTESIRQVASALKSEGLYAAALNEYGKLLDRGDLSAEQKANVLLLMGDMQRENLKDYEGALASYVRIKTLYPESSAAKKAEREMVTCLEFLDRGRDAERQLAKVTDLKPREDEVKSSDVVVARIGQDRKITLREIEDAIAGLPEYMRSAYEDQEKKLDFVRTYVAKELMANMAVRKGYDKEREVRESVESYRRGLLAERIYAEEVRAGVRISEGDVDLYYRANQEKYTEPERVRVAHIQVSDEARAKDIIGSVTEGTDFAALAEAVSEDETTRGNGGVLSPFHRGGHIPGIGRAEAFTEAAFSMEVGDVTGPVKTDQGYHILKLVEKIPEKVRPLDEVRTVVENSLRSQKESEAFQELIDRMLKAQEAVIYEEALREKGS